MIGRFPAQLVRPDLRDFTGYSSARTSHTGPPARVWLNANEAADASAVDPGGRLRRYPEPQPGELRTTLAAYYGVAEEALVIGRGSDEVIELLVRGLCRPAGDGVVVTSPTFGMYAVSARLHGVPVHDVPQVDAGDRWEVDLTGVARAARETGSRLVFLASPGNPSGSTVPVEDVLDLAHDLRDQAVVVLDEAYTEFADTTSLVRRAGAVPTLVVLRTLSKAHGLAAARVGVGVGHPDLVALLRRVQAPYPVPTPVADLAVAALAPAATGATRERVERARDQRERLAGLLTSSALVRRVYASEGNFLLVRSTDPDRLLGRLADAGVVVRDVRHQPQLGDALRVSVGTAAHSDLLEAALAETADSTSHATTTPTPPTTVRTR